MAAGLRMVCATLALAALTACTDPPRVADPGPVTRPVQPPETAAQPSDASLELAGYYRRLEADQLARGLMRTDGGGPDTPFDETDLLRDFEALVFSDEYQRGAGSGGRLNRWATPVRIGLEFGPSVGQDRQRRDQNEVAAYAARLSRVTGHAVSTVQSGANFHILVVGEDDKAFAEQRAREVLPQLTRSDLALLRNLPREYYCLVLTVPNLQTYTHTGAIVLIRNEHSGLMRESCFHEEIAQGLGIPNDSPRARPSIFNDDDEFALLTHHDELLLKMLYDPRLKPGMTAAEARPIATQIARELMGGES
ncbi:DUF2927 domain-containing protein [Seohaeicola nanhaiensis]|uniref:DUF2927 domain-containing protein n=1 Tax=Seohaeicola nanhaiensis TaxID=1387282 RepID=A0ABV9KI49_9RHOB